MPGEPGCRHHHPLRYFADVLERWCYPFYKTARGGYHTPWTWKDGHAMSVGRNVSQPD